MYIYVLGYIMGILLNIHSINLSLYIYIYIYILHMYESSIQVDRDMFTTTLCIEDICIK